MADNELDDILEELKNDKTLSTLREPPSAQKLNISDDNVNDYIMQKIGGLIESGIETVNAIRGTISSGFEAEELSAFSSLIASITNAAEVINKINIQNKKAKSSKEIKQLELESKKQLGGMSKHGDTNILIATREEIVNQFLEKNKKYIDTTATEHTKDTDDTDDDNEGNEGTEGNEGSENDNTNNN